jgi:hypothetical protein
MGTWQAVAAVYGQRFSRKVAACLPEFMPASSPARDAFVEMDGIG